MRHFGGYGYEEIAQKMQVPVGTAKWRVSKAADKIRAIVDPSGRHSERTSAFCGRARLLDYLYGLLEFDQVSAVRAHIRTCDHCRESIRELRGLVSALDQIESERKMMHIVDIGSDGIPLVYSTAEWKNESDNSDDRISFYGRKEARLLHLICDGEGLSYETEPKLDYPGRLDYTAKAPKPVPPGGRMQIMMMFHPGPELYRNEDLGNGRFRFHWSHKPSRDREYVFVQTIRLPEGSSVLACEPEVSRVDIKNNRAIVHWTELLSPDERFNSSVEYSM